MIATDALTKEELYYLKLLVHNYSYKEIENYLELTERELQVVEQKVKQKLNTSHCCDTIIKAFKMNILNAYDFVNASVKSEMSICAHMLFDTYFAKKRALSKAMKTIEEDVLNVLKTCHQRVKEEHLEKGLSAFSLNPSERDYLVIRYKGFKREVITRSFLFSKDDISEMEIGILEKLQVNCWYNAYRRALELELLKRLDYDGKVMKMKLSKFEQYMLTSDRLKNFKEKICVDVLYRELIGFYNSIEYNTLHKVTLNTN